MDRTIFIAMGVLFLFAMLIPSRVGSSDTTPSIWPVAGWVTSDFGYRRSPLRRSPALGGPVRSGSRFHEGIDIASPKGMPIFATADGSVRFAGHRSGYGKVVVLEHEGGLSSIYGHASKLLVTKGMWVKRGTMIARIGSTGVSTGPHLHYEVHVRGIPQDPLRYLTQVTMI